MQITLTWEEMHWLRYAITAAGWEDAGKTPEARKVLLSILEKLNQASQQEISINPPDELD